MKAEPQPDIAENLLALDESGIAPVMSWCECPDTCVLIKVTRNIKRTNEKYRNYTGHNCFFSIRG